MKLFSGTSNFPLSEKIAKALHVFISPLEIHVFPDGERRVRVMEEVVGEDCIVVESTGMPVDQNYIELLLITDALKRSGAKSVCAVIPYMGYARQDHVFRSGEARSFAVMVKMLEGAGVDKAVVCDLHSIKIPELFKIPVKHISALPLFVERIKEICSRSRRSDAQDLQGLDSILVSPDMGGVRRIKLLSEMLSGMSYTSVVKNRDLSTGEISADALQGEVKERAFIVDDMISTGGTIVQAAEVLYKRGAREIFVFATHGVLSEHASEILQNSALQKVFLTDSIDVPKNKQFAKLEILSIAQIIVKEIGDVL